MGGGGSGTSEELSGLEAAVRGSAEALCRYTHGFTAGAGPSLKESLRQLCSAVVDPSRELIGRVKVRTGLDSVPVLGDVSLKPGRHTGRSCRLTSCCRTMAGPVHNCIGGDQGGPWPLMCWCRTVRLAARGDNVRTRPHLPLQAGADATELRRLVGE